MPLTYEERLLILFPFFSTTTRFAGTSIAETAGWLMLKGALEQKLKGQPARMLPCTPAALCCSAHTPQLQQPTSVAASTSALQVGEYKVQILAQILVQKYKY